VAEQAGLMRLLTLSVLEKSLRQLADWRHAGIDLSMAVNLSVSNLQDAALPGQVQLLLETLDVPAEALVLEITENILMADPDRALLVLAQLRKLGLRLSIDDYGTGYSSLAYLRQLPVDELKLDRTFVTHMDTDPRSAAIVLSTIALAHSLDMVMVAEGVEGPAALAALADAGCDRAQGYYIARPQAAHKLTPWLIDRLAATTGR
jgi:EAL domain-containing protein (putative c-di-GMP-specific phosphodiesterase class I)